MIGATLGPYRLERELGAGGMGTVYAAIVVGATDAAPPSGRVAVKVLHPHLAAAPGSLERFLREARIGRSVRHENVVRTLDAGETDVGGRTIRWIAMEHVEGRTLRALLDAMGPVPESLLREIARQTAAGLAAIHAAGAVHRDLKPDNVLVTDDQRVRIMDLGVARPQGDAAALTREGQFAGSLLYAAPEQLRGEAVGPAADLYAAGMTFYELATGRHPFASEEVAAVVTGHLTRTPPPACDAAPDLSLFFADVLAALLAKRPEERLASAEALRRVLDEGEASPWWAEREARLLRASRRTPRVPVRRDAELRGRGPLVRRLTTAWRDARAGRGGVVLLEGEAGAGKSRVVDALVHEAAAEDAHLLYGSYAPSGGRGGLSEAVLEHFGTAHVEEALRPYLADVASLVPGFAAALRQDAAPAGATALGADAVPSVLRRLLEGLAAEKPVLWIVEDLHFASADDRRLVLALARAVAGRAALLVVTSRPGLPGDELVRFGQLPEFSRAALERLGADDVATLLADLLRNAPLAERLAPRVAVRSEGVPFFVVETVRGMKDAGLLVAGPGGALVPRDDAALDRLVTPPTVQDLVAARLAELSPDERALLEIGAADGYQFDPDLVARVHGVPRLAALRTLAEIERRTGIVRSGPGSCRFDHHQVQEVLYASLTPDLRAEVHAALAEEFAARDGLDTTADGGSAYFLAWHGLLGARPSRFAALVPRAVDHVARSFGNEAVVRLLDAAAAAAVEIPGLDWTAALLRKAECLARLGRRAEERAALEEAVRLASARGDRVAEGRALRALAQHEQVVARFEASLRTAERALAVARDSGDAGGESQSLQAVGGAQWRLGRGPAAQEAIEASVALARRAADRAQEARALAALAALHGDLLSRPRRSGELYDEVVALRRSLGDDLRDAALQNNLAWSNLARGRLAAALDHLDTVRSIVRETGALLGNTIHLTNRGLLLILLGDFAAARAALSEARTICREIAERRSEGYAVHRLGRAAEEADDSETAVRLFDEAAAIHTSIRYPRGVAESSLAAGRVLLGMGVRSDAARRLDAAAAVAAELDIAGLRVVAELHAARLDGRRGPDALARLAASDDRLDALQALEARHAAWALTEDPAHLDAARRDLSSLVAGAPEEHRASMTANVRLFREIAHGHRG